MTAKNRRGETVPFGKAIAKRGFANMDPDKQREIARRGGRAAHEKGSAHEFSSDEARDAGRKGGERVSADRGRMEEIGRRGGLISAARRAAKSRIQPSQQTIEIASATKFIKINSEDGAGNIILESTAVDPVSIP